MTSKKEQLERAEKRAEMYSDLWVDSMQVESDLRRTLWMYYELIDFDKLNEKLLELANLRYEKEYAALEEEDDEE